MYDTLIEKFISYLKLNDYSPSYIRPTKRFLKYCIENKVDIYKITYEDISKYLLSKKDSLKNTSLNLMIFTIRFFYKFMEDIKEPIRPEIKEELLKVRGLKINRVIKETVNFNQVNSLIENCLAFNYPINPYKLKALMYFMFYTGIRSNELINLKRQDVNLSEKTALIRVPTKNKKERLVYFPIKVKLILRKYFTDEPEVSNCFNITTAQLKGIFKFLKQFDNKIHPHLMRHSFTQMLAYQGIDIRIVQELLGHKSLSSTLIYYNPNTETVRKQYQEKIK